MDLLIDSLFRLWAVELFLPRCVSAGRTCRVLVGLKDEMLRGIRCSLSTDLVAARRKQSPIRWFRHGRSGGRLHHSSSNRCWTNAGYRVDEAGENALAIKDTSIK
jgi:hypothetical protein